MNRFRATGHRRLLAAGLVVVATVALGACSSDDDDPLADTESIDSSPEEGEEGGADEAGEAGDGSPSGADDDSSTDGEGGDRQVIATVTGTMPASVIDDTSVPLRLELVRLERVGEMVELTIDVVNESDVAWTPDVVFSGGNYGVGSRYDAAGVGLVDGEGQKIYLPAFDSEDNCLCKSNLNNEEVAGGATLTMPATYGGVPEDVERVDVRIPNFPTMSDVPIS
jgi:hypothetical protein